MTAVPISVTITVGDVKGEWVMVEDPRAPFVAYQIGQAVATFILEHAPNPESENPHSAGSPTP